MGYLGVEGSSSFGRVHPQKYTLCIEEDLFGSGTLDTGHLPVVALDLESQRYKCHVIEVTLKAAHAATRPSLLAMCSANLLN